VHALETIHTALRPHGLLLDVRPAPRHPVVEARRGDAVVPLGHLDDGFRIGTLAVADAALQRLIDAGRFIPEREETFTFVYHCDGVDEWLAYMAEHWSTARVDVDLIARARAALPEGTGELRVLREIRAARLRRARGR
jgi:hypothetical protein